MLHFHLPALNHVAELGDAVVYELLLVIVTIADDPPEVFSGSLLEGCIFGEFPKLTYNLELFETDFL
jgi:hypothetical protein